jgi:hypothetical protein
MGAVSVRRRGMGSPDPRKTWQAPPANPVPNRIASKAFFHLDNTRKRQGFSGLPFAASCGG